MSHATLIIKYSNVVMHHVLIILTLTFIQGHIYLNHENNKCVVISETIEAIPIKFAVKICRRKVNIIFFLSQMTLLFTQGHNCVSNLTKFNLY